MPQLAALGSSYGSHLCHVISSWHQHPLPNRLKPFTLHGCFDSQYHLIMNIIIEMSRGHGSCLARSSCASGNWRHACCSSRSFFMSRCKDIAMSNTPYRTRPHRRTAGTSRGPLWRAEQGAVNNFPFSNQRMPPRSPRPLTNKSVRSSMPPLNTPICNATPWRCC